MHERYTAFLQNPLTIANQDRDFREWHGGIAEYGVWVVLVQEPSWQAGWLAAGGHLQDLLHRDYLRQPHITLAACGLMHKAHFSQQELDAQIALLESIKPAAFTLRAGGLNSFTTAPYIEVIDGEGHLARLRHALDDSGMLQADAARPYVPHVTVGLYDDHYCTHSVSARLAGFTHTAPPLRVSELQFCTYETHDIKGALSVRHRIRL